MGDITIGIIVGVVCSIVVAAVVCSVRRATRAYRRRIIADVQDIMDDAAAKEGYRKEAERLFPLHPAMPPAHAETFETAT